MRPLDTPCLLAVQMDVETTRIPLFHEVYDCEHVPALLSVPGVRSVRRLQRAEALTMAFGQDVRAIAFPDEPVFSALYELDCPEVLLTPEWAAAVEMGRWPSSIRPFTRNRRHTLHRTLSWAIKP